jgi:hypothetical protein
LIAGFFAITTPMEVVMSSVTHLQETALAGLDGTSGSHFGGPISQTVILRLDRRISTGTDPTNSSLFSIAGAGADVRVEPEPDVESLQNGHHENCWDWTLSGDEARRALYQSWFSDDETIAVSVESDYRHPMVYPGSTGILVCCALGCWAAAREIKTIPRIRRRPGIIPGSPDARRIAWITPRVAPGAENDLAIL